jgi:hypothetical protein
VIGLDAHLPGVRELVLDAEDDVVGALRARILVNAVLDLQLVDAGGLLVATPAGTKLRRLSELVEQVETRPELLVGILDIGLLVPAQAELCRQAWRELPA